MRRRDLLLLTLACAVLPGAALASGGKSEKKKGGGASYLQIASITATTVRASGSRGVLTVESGLDVPDAGLRDRADASMPRIRAAFVQVVQTYAAGLAPDTAPNCDFLARALQGEADRMLGRKGARLLLGTVLVN